MLEGLCEAAPEVAAAWSWRAIDRVPGARSRSLIKADMRRSFLEFVISAQCRRPGDFMPRNSARSQNHQRRIQHRASPKPPPRGRQLEDGWHDYAGMTADEAYRNAQSYQAYCDPETLGKPPDPIP